MKTNNKRSSIVVLTALTFGICLSGSDAATYFFGQNPDGSSIYDGTFALPTGFTTTGINHLPQNTTYTSNGSGGGQATVSEPDVDGEQAKSISFLLGDVAASIPAGESIDSISMRLFLDAGNFSGMSGGSTPSLTVGIFEGVYTAGNQLGALTTILGTFTMQASNVGNWMDISLPLSVLSTGFSFSARPEDQTATLVFAGSYGNFVFNDPVSAPANKLPGFTVTTTPIPEPSVGLLGLLGGLGLLRRRRV